jgi:L-ascorbate metabolism protein UlaG (beta-lactamase superfamily)
MFAAVRRVSLTLAVLGALTAPAMACGVVAGGPIWRASFEPDQASAVSITFLGHASFLIETPQHVTAVTDYNGINIPAAPPDIATMNHAHSTHYTMHPDPRIAHVLHGWRDDGKPADWDLTVGDLNVTNLATNIREWGGGGTESNGNSVFVFRTAGLCIAHLSHLHHLLTQDDLATLGQIDIVMAPVDGVWTLSHDDMAAVLDQLHPRLVLPMHYFTRDVLNRFLGVVGDKYAVDFSPSPSVVISRATLPDQPTIVVLPGN